MISEFCCNEKFGFPYKISPVNELSEQLLISQLMFFNLFKNVPDVYKIMAVQEKVCCRLNF